MSEYRSATDFFVEMNAGLAELNNVRVVTATDTQTAHLAAIAYALSRIADHLAGPASAPPEEEA